MQFHTRYVRLPSNVSDFYDELVYRSKRIVVGSSQVMSANAVTFDGKVVLASGYPIVYFNLMGKWFGVGKIRDLDGNHTGYYCDIVVPPRSSEGTIKGWRHLLHLPLFTSRQNRWRGTRIRS